MPREPAEQRESSSLLGLDSHPRCLGCRDLHAEFRKAFAQHPHQGAVLRAAASNEEFSSLRRGCAPTKMRPAEPAIRCQHGSRRQRRRCCHHVFLRPALAQLQQSVHERFAKLLATTRLRRRGREVSVEQQLLHHLIQDTPPCRNRSTKVDVLVKQPLHQSIDHHIRRPGIEGQHIGHAATRRQCRDVGNAAQVQQQPVLRRVAKDAEVEHRHQRRALPAGSDIRRAKVTHHRQPQPLADHRGLTNLPRHSVGRIMQDGLSMARDQLRPQPQLARGGLHAIRIDSTQPP